MVFYFVIEKTSYSLPMCLVTIMYFVPVGKRSKSRSQIFYKKDVPENLAVFTGKHYKFTTINFIKEISQHRCFPMNIAKCLSTTLFGIPEKWAPGPGTRDP